MSRPKAYEPEHGYYAQLFCRHPATGGKEWDAMHYVETKIDLFYDLEQQQIATQGQGIEYKYIILPAKYWNKEKVQADMRQRREAARQRRLAASGNGMSVGLDGQINFN